MVQYPLHYPGGAGLTPALPIVVRPQINSQHNYNLTNGRGGETGGSPPGCVLNRKCEWSKFLDEAQNSLKIIKGLNLPLSWPDDILKLYAPDGGIF